MHTQTYTYMVCIHIHIKYIFKVLILLKCQYYPKLHVVLMTIKIPMMFFVEIENPILKFIWTLKGPQLDKKKIL